MKHSRSTVLAASAAGAALAAGGPLVALAAFKVPSSSQMSLACTAWAVAVPWLAWGAGCAVSRRQARRGRERPSPALRRRAR